MIPRDEFAALVAGSVTADEFVLVRGTEVVGRLDPLPGLLPSGASDGAAIRMIHNDTVTSRLLWTKPAPGQTFVNVSLETPEGAGSVGLGVQLLNQYRNVTDNRLSNVVYSASQIIGADVGASVASLGLQVIDQGANENAGFILSASRSAGAVVQLIGSTSTGRITLTAQTGGIWFGGAMYQRTRLMNFVDAGTFVGTTDAGSNVGPITYNVPWAATPIIVAWNGDRAAASFTAQLWSRSATQFFVNTNLGAGVTVRIDWIAVGQVA